MTQEEIDYVRELVDWPKKELRLVAGSDLKESDRLEETRGWTRGELVAAILELLRSNEDE